MLKALTSKNIFIDLLQKIELTYFVSKRNLSTKFVKKRFNFCRWWPNRLRKDFPSYEFFHQFAEMHLSTPDTPAIRKYWHIAFSDELRKHLTAKLIYAIFPFVVDPVEVLKFRVNIPSLGVDFMRSHKSPQKLSKLGLFWVKLRNF